MPDPMKKDIWNSFQKIRKITVAHIPERAGLRFDYDCKLYREGTINDLIGVRRSFPGDSRKILDVGCGFGPISCTLSALGFDVQGIDVEETANYYGHFKMTKRHFEDIWRDLEGHFRGVRLRFYEPYRFPFVDESFDAVLFYAVLEHIPTEHALFCLQEAHRVLNSKGTLFIFRCPSELAFTERLGRILGIPGHDTLYGEQALRNVIVRGGFRIEDLGKTDLFPAFLPMGLQWLLDSQGFWLIPLQEILLKTALKRWAHHYNVRAVKV